MLLCKKESSIGIWYTLNQNSEFGAAICRAEAREKGFAMSRTTSATLHAPTVSSLSRLFAAIDRLLLAYAEMTIRNGDIPRHGV
jgi:hypothetical protein